MSKLAWKNIHTVLLDMDGTLLDLHFDNHFWLEHVPKRLSEKHSISLQAAKDIMAVETQQVMGTLSWYCLDFWAEKLDIDIIEAKREIEHLISIREDSLPFIDALKASGRDVILVTNAHPDSLSLKVEHTQLNNHIDQLISTHEFSVTKESQVLWQRLQAKLGFNPEHTLFVDDSLGILKAAQDFGIKHLLAVSNPDSRQPARKISEFPSIQDYRFLLDEIVANPFVN
ncbi:MAG: putative hydrolase of the HAD superfamily [Paraglaciecola sp.]|uniref:GMP/IMP nucleotidase n=1 Tax=uncultured Paraglaciecola sp. TaxID=1765024 RepID=UPI0025D2BF2E|nr:GMP/IMP nucleotidase [uncultured Paraglaciecola sp.]